MTFADTIVACATGLAPGARAVVRMSGPEAAWFASERLGLPSRARFAGGRRLVLKEVQFPVLVIFAPGPRSYTGEDTLEMLLPGGPALVRRVVDELCARPGVRHAEPGEFSARAYLNGRLTLEQAEGVSGVIAASSRSMLDAARDAMSGAAGARYAAWAEEIASILALVEAGIDFSDQEDVVAIAPDELRRRVRALTAEMLARAGGPSEQGSARVRVALAGRPSAGKSTLFNALLGRARCVVSASPGTTRDAVVEPLTLHDDPRGPITVDLADLAGVDGASPVGEIDAAAQSRARAEIQRAQIVLMCRAPEIADDGVEVLDGVGVPSDRIVEIRTKADRPGPVWAGAIGVCAIDGRGLDTLRRVLAERAWARAASVASGGAAGACLPRHRAAISAALKHLSALESLEGETHAELVADTLRAALDELGELTGRVERDVILGRVFASFCIGK